MSIAKEMDEAIEKYFELPPDILKLANQAAYDLYNGPIQDDDEWPGFVTACEQITDWCDDNLSEVWYDIQSGEVLDREPEGYFDHYCGNVEDDEPIETWVEPHWEDYFHCELDTVKRALFDKELVQHI